MGKESEGRRAEGKGEGERERKKRKDRKNNLVAEGIPVLKCRYTEEAPSVSKRN